jgi:hypothetical protein
VETDLLSDSPTSVFASDLQEATRQSAEEIYVQSGRIPGRDVENWTQAEREIREQAEKGNRRAAILVRVNGSQYVGSIAQTRRTVASPGKSASVLRSPSGCKATRCR